MLTHRPSAFPASEFWSKRPNLACTRLPTIAIRISFDSSSTKRTCQCHQGNISDDEPYFRRGKSIQKEEYSHDGGCRAQNLQIDSGTDASRTPYLPYQPLSLQSGWNWCQWWSKATCFPSIWKYRCRSITFHECKGTNTNLDVNLYELLLYGFCHLSRSPDPSRTAPWTISMTLECCIPS